MTKKNKILSFVASVGAGFMAYQVFKPSSADLELPRIPNLLIKNDMDRIEKSKPKEVVFTFTPSCDFEGCGSTSVKDPPAIQLIARTLANSDRSASMRLHEPEMSGCSHKEGCVHIGFKLGSQQESSRSVCIHAAEIQDFWGKDVRKMIDDHMATGWSIYVTKESKHYPEEVLGPIRVN